MVARKIQYLFCFLLLAFSEASARDRKKSFTLVFDDSGSMLNTLRHVKNSLNRLFNIVLESETQIADYVLVTFNDPDSSLRTITKDRKEFMSALDDVKINYGSGGDCPESSMAGVINGLKSSRPGSTIYIFTDASAKDYTRYEEVKALALKKQAKLVFILSGSCGSTTSEDFTVYQSLADDTTGLYLVSDGTRRVNEQLKFFVLSDLKMEAPMRNVTARESKISNNIDRSQLYQQ